MKRRLMTVFILLLLALNISALGTFAYFRWIHPEHPIGCKHEESTVCPLYRRLRLDESQRVSMDKLRDVFEDRAADITADLPLKHDRLVDLLTDINTDMDEMEQVVTEMDAIQSRLQREIVAYFIEVKSILSPEQQEIFFMLFQKSCQQKCQMQNYPKNQKERIEGR